MSVRRTATRSLGVLALVAPATLVFAVATAPVALAATSFTSPGAGQEFTSGSTITVKGVVPQCSAETPPASCPTVNLTVFAPDGSNQAAPSVKESKNAAGTIQVVVTISPKTRNGKWTAQLSGDGDTSRSFTTNYAPLAPAGPFQASGSGARDVFFSWDKGPEPDLTGYTLSDEHAVLAADLTPSDVGCSSSTKCSYGYHYAADNPGSHDYQLVAKRSSGSSGGTVASSPSTASATLTAPQPTPQPTGTPDSGGTTGGGTAGGSTTGGSSTGGSSTGGSSTGGSSTGGSSSGTATGTGGAIGGSGAKPTLPPSATNPVLAQRRAFALTFNAFSPSLGIPKLPPLPAPSFTGEAPLPQGTYQPSLPYSPQSETTKTTSILSSPANFVRSTFTDTAQLAKSIAVALILLAVGAHLRRYLAVHVED